MAIPSFSPSNYFHPFTQFTISKPFHFIYSPPWLNPPKFIIVHSSTCPPPMLEEEPSSHASPLVQLTYDSNPNPNPNPSVGFKSTRDVNGQDMNKLLLNLLKDPSTQSLGMEYYEKAKASPGFVPQVMTLKSILRYLVKSKKWDLIIVVCKDMVVYKVLPNGMFCGTIVSTCIKARKFKVADMLLKSIEIDEKIASFGYASAIRSYNKLHMYGISIDLYERMKASTIALDPGGYVLVMDAYLKLGDYDKVVELFSELDGNYKVEDLENGVQVYGVLIEALGKARQGFRALEEFERMREKGIPSSALIYTALISSLADMRKIDLVEGLVEEAASKQMVKDPALFLKLVIMYVEEGLMERTLSVVKIMKGANLKVSDCIFCAIVNGYTKKRGLKMAAKVYEELVLEGCEPGQVTYASIINVFFRLGLFSKAKKVFEEMQLRGFDRCVVAYSTMIVMYGKTGQLREAMKLLAKMKERGCEPNVWVYNALIDVHGRANNLRQVDKIWKEMKRKKVKPDRVSYTSIIGAYSKAKEYEGCIEFYEEYRLNGGKIDLAMAGIMVGVFSKINRIDELVKLLQNLKAEGTKLDARLYKSAYNAMTDAGLQMQTTWLEENFGGSLSESLVDKDVRSRKSQGLITN
ncbi:pentatricopeptide repeat-containing protein At5g13770, chloroplastic [Silene latifolia]|uniref:pentatricopeptide repeat-containing protein At5g13770, chloroplastic n=1 Tax=Silene latifolia TaxID=37657 RepID=UPI003D77118C